MLTRIRHILEMIRFSHTLFALPFALLATVLACRLLGAEAALKQGIVQQADATHPARHASQSSAIPVGPNCGNYLTNFPQCVTPFLSGPGSEFSASCCAWWPAAVPRWRSIAWPIVKSTHSIRAPPADIFRLELSASAAWPLLPPVRSVAFVASTLLFLPNRLPLYLSVPMLLILLGYSYAKRFTLLAHFWLGGALGLAPVLAWIALRGENIEANPWDLLPVIILGGAVMLWVAGFDIIYACQDVDFDRAAWPAQHSRALGRKNCVGHRRHLSPGNGGPSPGRSIGLSFDRMALVVRHRSHCHPVDLRTSLGEPHRFGPREHRLFQRKRRRQRRPPDRRHRLLVG